MEIPSKSPTKNSKKNIRIKGKAKEILPKVEREILKLQIKNTRKITKEGKWKNAVKGVGVALILFLILFSPIFLFLFSEEDIFSDYDYSYFFIGLGIMLLLHFFIEGLKHLNNVFHKKELSYSLRPVLSYDLLLDLLKYFSETFPEEKIIVELNRDFKTREIMRVFLRNSSLYKLFGRKFLYLKKDRIGIRLALKKWRILIPSKNASIVLKYKVKLVSRRFWSSGGKERTEAKTRLKAKLILKKNQDKKVLPVIENFGIKKEGRIPEYTLPERKLIQDTYKEMLNWLKTK